MEEFFRKDDQKFAKTFERSGRKIKKNKSIFLHFWLEVQLNHLLNIQGKTTLLMYFSWTAFLKHHRVKIKSQILQVKKA